MAVKGILEINDILNDYSHDVQDAITSDAQIVARQAVKSLKATSPKRTGDYQKGWRVKTTKGKGFVECIIHNSTNYQLTHLLEKPHALRNGGMSTPKVHIAPVEQNCVKEYDVKATVRGGGVNAQAEALRLGISKCLAEKDPNYKTSLRNAGLLTRDPRVVESKKAGRKKARKGFQFSKR